MGETSPLPERKMNMQATDNPVQWLFLDLNAFFASCEQQENPALRGAARPGSRRPASAGSVRGRQSPAAETVAADRSHQRPLRPLLDWLRIVSTRRARVQGPRRVSPGAKEVGVLRSTPVSPAPPLKLAAAAAPPSYSFGISVHTRGPVSCPETLRSI